MAFILVSERFLGIPSWIAVVGLCGFVFSVGLYAFGLGVNERRYPVSKHEIVARARTFAAEQGVDVTTAAVTSQSVRLDRSLEQKLFQLFGAKRTLEASESGELPLAAWRVTFRKSKLVDDLEEDPGGFRVTLSERGDVLAATFFIPPTKEPGPSRAEARALALEKLASMHIDISGFAERSDDNTKKPKPKTTQRGLVIDFDDEPSPPPPTNATDPSTAADNGKDDDDDDDDDEAERPKTQKFVWARAEAQFPGVERQITVTIGASGIRQYSQSIKVDSDIESSIVIDIVEGMVYGLLCTVLVIILPGITILRIVSKDYVSIRRTIFVAFLFIPATVFQWMLINNYDGAIAVSTVGFTLLGALLSVFVFGAWLAGEADAYFAWGRQSTEGLVGLLTFRVRARQVWREVLEGYFWGWAFLAVLAAVAVVVILAFGSDAVIRKSDLYPADVNPSWMYWFGIIPYLFFYAVVCLLFLPAWMYRITKRTWAAVALSAFPAGLFAAYLGLADMGFAGVRPGVSWGLALSIGAIILVARRGVLTATLSMFYFSAFYYGLAGIFTGATDVAVSCVVGLALVSLPPGVAMLFGPALKDEEFSEAPPPRMSRLMDRARRMEELNIAQRVQEGLLPSKDPSVPGFDIAGLCRPATEVGGDYFDYFKLADGRFGVAVGDVSGKGVPAAFFMTLTKGFMEVAATEEPTPQDVLANANRHLRDHLARGTFVTMVYVVLDPEASTAVCARAGHNPPVFARKDGQVDYLALPGLALGAAPDDQFQSLIGSGTLELRDGDTVVLYTDGVTEAMNAQREEYGEERLLESVRRHHAKSTARDVLENLLREISEFTLDANQHDDITIVVVKAALQMG